MAPTPLNLRVASELTAPKLSDQRVAQTISPPLRELILLNSKVLDLLMQVPISHTKLPQRLPLTGPSITPLLPQPLKGDKLLPTNKNPQVLKEELRREQEVTKVKKNMKSMKRLSSTLREVMVVKSARLRLRKSRINLKKKSMRNTKNTKRLSKTTLVVLRRTNPKRPTTRRSSNKRKKSMKNMRNTRKLLKTKTLLVVPTSVSLRSQVAPRNKLPSKKSKKNMRSTKSTRRLLSKTMQEEIPRESPRQREVSNNSKSLRTKKSTKNTRKLNMKTPTTRLLAMEVPKRANLVSLK